MDFFRSDPRTAYEALSEAQRIAFAPVVFQALFWDRQPDEIAAFCLQQTSLYFACIANGNSQMYRSEDLLRCLAESGLTRVEQRDHVGPYHTLLKCSKA